MEVESDRHLQFRAIYESCRMASIYLDNKWEMDSLEELYLLDRKEWNDDYVYLHEKTLNYSLEKLEIIFPKLVRKALNLVGKTQAYYWQKRDPVFNMLCRNGELLWALKRMEKRIKGSQ